MNLLEPSRSGAASLTMDLAGLIVDSSFKAGGIWG